jgi:hypothetical protein
MINFTIFYNGYRTESTRNLPTRVSCRLVVTERALGYQYLSLCVYTVSADGNRGMRGGLCVTVYCMSDGIELVYIACENLAYTCEQTKI